MSKEFQRREVLVLDLPVEEGFEAFNPEQVVVRIPNVGSIDLGALCYGTRLPREFGARSSGAKVVFSSFMPERVGKVKKLIWLMAGELRNGVRPLTVFSKYGVFCIFLKWADASGHINALDTPVTARDAFEGYVSYLRDRVARSDGISNNTGANYQSQTLQVLKELVNAEDLARGLNLLRVDRSGATSTSPPDEAAQGRVLTLCEATFHGLTSLVVEGLSFPYALAMPENLGYPGNRLWLFPTCKWACPPGEIKPGRSRFGHWGYDYARGCAASLDSLRSLGIFQNDERRKTAIERAELQIAGANSDSLHVQRLAFGVIAVKSFVLQFVAQTGMNWAQVRELKWDDKFTVESSRQGFRTIKPRAGSKAVSFELPVEFLQVFRRYLELRKYLLRDFQCDLLFFGLGYSAVDPPRAISRSANSIYMTLRRLDSSLPKVMPREWRAAKSDWLVRHEDVDTAALVLQTSVQTLLKRYAEGSETLAIEEMGKFLTEVSQRVFDENAPLPGIVDGALNKCAKLDCPSPDANPAVTPDCRSPEGCLFCTQHRLHADPQDTRKLLSCRLVILRVTPALRSEIQVQTVSEAVVARIDELLAEVRVLNPLMVDKVTHEVEVEGELDSFWARKLEMLLELGVVT